MASPSAENAPAFDWRGTTFLDYEHQVHLWARAAKTELAARASLQALRVQPAPRQVCLAGGSDISDHGDEAARILDISRSYFAPEEADAIHQQVARFMNYRKSDQSVD